MTIAPIFLGCCIMLILDGILILVLYCIVKNKNLPILDIKSFFVYSNKTLMVIPGILFLVILLGFVLYNIIWRDTSPFIPLYVPFAVSLFSALPIHILIVSFAILSTTALPRDFISKFRIGIYGRYFRISDTPEDM